MPNETSPPAPGWFLYMIKTNDGSLYTGVSTNVERRFQEHVAQGPKCAKYLKGKSPLQLVFTAPVGSKGEAYRLEKRVKGLSKRKKLELVAGEVRLYDIATETANLSNRNRI